ARRQSARPLPPQRGRRGPRSASPLRLVLLSRAEPRPPTRRQSARPLPPQRGRRGPRSASPLRLVLLPRAEPRPPTPRRSRPPPAVNPLAHSPRNGAAERRDPHPLFETAFYLEQKPHVVALGVNPLAHFLAEGPTPAFDPLSVPPPVSDTGICIVTPDVVGP